MNSKERDIKKLKKYANKLGISVHILPFKRGVGSAEYISGKSINIFVTKRTPKYDIILSLLHEIGHHCDWLKRKTPRDAVKAFHKLIDGNMFGKRLDLDKETRKLIYNEERFGIKYMPKIAKQLELEIPLWRVKFQRDIDIFAYRYLYQKGSFPTQDQVIKYSLERGRYYQKRSIDE